MLCAGDREEKAELSWYLTSTGVDLILSSVDEIRNAA